MQTARVTYEDMEQDFFLFHSSSSSSSSTSGKRGIHLLGILVSLLKQQQQLLPRSCVGGRSNGWSVGIRCRVESCLSERESRLPVRVNNILIRKYALRVFAAGPALNFGQCTAVVNLWAMHGCTTREIY